MKTPNIGETVLHLLPDGTWIEDWCCQVLLVVGKKKVGDKEVDVLESGVVIWGETKARHVPRFDIWKER